MKIAALAVGCSPRQKIFNNYDVDFMTGNNLNNLINYLHESNKKYDYIVLFCATINELNLDDNVYCDPGKFIYGPADKIFIDIPVRVSSSCIADYDFELFYQPRRIAVLLTGRWRSNETNKINCKDACAVTHVKHLNSLIGFKFGFNIISAVDYFIVTNDLDIEKTKNVYGSIKMMYFTDINKMIIGSDVKFDVDESHVNDAAQRMKKIGPPYWLYPETVNQWYKLRQGFNLMESYENGAEYDYVIRLRPDSKITKPFTRNHFMKLIDQEYLWTLDDWFAFGTRKTMKNYCDVIYNYGKYMFSTHRYEFDYNGYRDMESYYKLGVHQWTFASEVQMAEHLLECRKKLPHQSGKLDNIELSNFRFMCM